MKTHPQFHRMLFVGLLLLTLAATLLVSISIDPPRAEAQKPQATATVATKQPLKPKQLPQITAASTVVQVGQWVAVTLTHGEPGHQGFFDAETPLRYKRTDGQPCTPGFACVTINAMGQAQVLVQAIAESDAVIHFTDTTADRTIAASVRIRFYEGGAPPEAPLASYPNILRVDPTALLNGIYLIGVWPKDASWLSVYTDMQTQDGQAWLEIKRGWITYKSERYRCSYSQSQGGAVCPLPLLDFLKNYLKSGDHTITIFVEDDTPNQRAAKASKSYSLHAVNAPEWLSELYTKGDLQVRAEGSDLIYEMTLEYPAGGMNWLALTFISNDGSNGTALGLQPSSKGQIVACKKILFKESAASSFTANSRTKLYSADLSGQVNASAEIDAEFANCKVWNPQLDGSLKVNATLAGDAKPNLRNMFVDFLRKENENIWSIVVKYFPGFVGVSVNGKMDPSLNAQVQINRHKPFVHASMTLQDPIALNGSMWAWSPILPTWWVKFWVSGAGNLEATANNITDFKHLQPHAHLGYEAQLLAGIVAPEIYLDITGEVKYPAGSAYPSILTSQTTTRPPQRAFSPTYATFQATPGKAQAFSRIGRAGLASSATITSVLVSNVYTFTQAALAVSPSNDHTLLLWAHDVPTKPFGASTEVHFSHWDGLSWTSPAAITNDDVMDLAPDVAWTSGNQAVALWQRMANSLPPTATNDITTTNMLEVASAVYDATTKTWSAPILLTSNSIADVAPQLARNSNGQLLAIWLQNDYGQLIGDNAQPSRLMTAFYNGAWGTPIVAVNPIADVTGLAAGYGNGQATIVFTRWFTPTGATEATHQLFATTWNGSTWSMPRQLINDTLNHMNPNVIYNPSNQPIVVWHTGNVLRLMNLQDGTVAAVPVPSEVGHINQLRVAQDASGNIVALIAASGSRQDLYVAYYERARNLWGMPRQLTNDIHVETIVDLALDSTGRPLAVYPVILQEQITRTMTLSDGKVVTFTVPTDRQTDLVTLSHVLTRNITLDALNVSNPRPIPGSKVTASAQVRNSGNLPIDGLAVSFYDGDPSAGGVLIGTSTRNLPLTSGYTTTLSISYTVPAAGGPRTLYAIADPANVIAESNEGDNRASLTAFGPDLHLEDVQVYYPYGNIAQVRTVVRNLGAGTSPATTLAYYKDAITGTLLLTQTIPALAYGESTTLIGGLDRSTLAEGEYNLYAVINAGGSTPPNIGTKQRQFSLLVGPDVIVSEYSLWRTPLTNATTRATAMVYNVGPIAATNVTVSFYAQPGLDGTPLATRTIAVLPPGQATRVSADLSGALCELYAYLESGNARYENRRGNMARAAGSSTTCALIYLPLISK